MTARIAVLTTQTPHHAYFLRELAAAGRLAAIVQETRSVTPPYETGHPFEVERDAWEIETLLSGEDVQIGEVAETTVVENVNDAATLPALERAGAELTIVFGTGLIGTELIERAPGWLLNLHGGDPERYRGVDTHLWAVWHRDWAGLVTALHVVAPRLDTGDVVATRTLEPPPGIPLGQLRAANTQACVELVLAAAEELDRTGDVATHPQAAIGRYYSFMPSVLKQACLARWVARP